MDVYPPTHAQVNELSALSSTSTASGTSNRSAGSTHNISSPDSPHYNFNNSPLGYNRPLSPFEIIDNALSVCKDDWICDFLFSKEMTALSVLLAPLNMRYAIPSSFQCTAVECDNSLVPDSPMNHIFDVQMAGDIVFVPAFSVQSTSVGFGIQQNSVLTRHKWGYHSPKNGGGSDETDCTLREYGHFKYVRCDKDDILMSCHEDANANIIRIDTSKILNIKERYRFMILLRRDMLYSKLAQRSSCNKSIFQIARECIVLTNYSLHQRLYCPYCNVKNYVNCDCQFNENVKPKHPYDFSSSTLNMGKHVGTYQGVSAETYFNEQHKMSMEKQMGTRIFITRAHESTLVQRLTQWAINDELKHTKIDPLKLSLPSPTPIRNSSSNQLVNMQSFTDNINTNSNGHASGVNGRQVNEEITDLMIGSFQHGQGIQEERHRSNHAAPMESEGRFNPILNEVDRILSTGNTDDAIMSGANGVNTSNHAHSHTNDNMNHTTLTSTTVNLMAPNMFNVNANQVHANGTGAGHQIAKIKEYGNDFDVEDDDEEDEDDLVLTERIATEAREAYENENAVWQPSGTFDDDNVNIFRQLDSEQGRQINGPADISSPENSDKMETGAGNNSGGSEEQNKSRKELDRERRAELRKQRNREAAQRSNLRRKLKNDTLKRDLKFAHEKASQLRARELSLREENIKLRRMLASST